MSAELLRPVPPVDPPVPERTPTIATLLAKARAAHLQKKHCAGRADTAGNVSVKPDYRAAEHAVRDALRYRREAHALDPDETDPAWSQDRALNNGVPSQRLLEYFEHYLTIP